MSSVNQIIGKLRGGPRFVRRQLLLLKLGNHPSWRRIGGEFEMYIDPSDVVDRAFYLGSFDGTLLSVITNLVNEGETCLDIGARKVTFP